jgi:hypothetical protein
MSSARCSFGICLILGGTSLLPHILIAQRSTTSTGSSPRVLVATGSGSPRGSRVKPPVRAVPSYTTAQLQALAATLGLSITTGAGAAKVSPNSLTAAGGRVELNFWEPDMVAPSVVFLRATSYIDLKIRALAAGEQYLIDCTVDGGTQYHMSAGGPSTAYWRQEHLLALYKAVDTVPVFFTIHADSEWRFFSCQVSKAQ